MTPTALSGAWWEARPRGLLELAKQTASSQLRIAHQAPPGMEQYQRDPVAFFVQELGIRRETIVWSENPGYENHRWDGTPDPLVRWAEALAEGKDVAVLSATGQGKSFYLALTDFWFLASWQGARCFNFAEKLDQLEEFSWTEKAKLWPKMQMLFPRAHMSMASLAIRMDGRVREGQLAGWGAVGRGYEANTETEIAGGGQGMHGAHMLITVEELANVPLSLMRAIKGTVGGRHNLRQGVGNPNSQDDALSKFAAEEGVVAIRISALDHPNVVVNVARDPEWKDVENDIDIVPGASGRKWIRSMEAEYPRDSWIYQSRVRGIAPPQHVKALIRQEHIDLGVELWEQGSKRHGLPALGVDVARSLAGNQAAIAEGVGAHLERVERMPCPDPVQLGLLVALRMTLRGILPDHVAVDAGGGYGGGTIDKLKEFGLYVSAFNGGASVDREVDLTLLDEEGVGVLGSVLFRNERASSYWRFAMDLQLGRIAIPPDPLLHEELKAVRWEPKFGKVHLDEKAIIEARLGRSPDSADAAVMWNWVRPRLSAVEETHIRAWDQDILEREAREGRRVRTRAPERDGALSPTIIERV